MSVVSTALPIPVDRSTSISRAGYLFLSVFLLVVFEGAIRKWISGSVSLPLILLRDLLAFWLVVHAWLGGHFRHQRRIAAIMFAWSLAVLGWGMLQLVGDESSPLMLVIGLRFWLLYTWFAVAAAASMTERDFRAALFTVAVVMILLAPLVVFQYLSPPGAFINTQVEGGEEGVFVVVAGVVRTTATFSFTSGFTNFMAVAAPVALGLLAATKRNLTQYVFASIVFAALLVGAVVSGSRGTVLSTGLMFGVYLVGRLIFSRMRKKPAALAAVLVALFMVGLAALIFQDAIQNTQTRFEDAAAAEDFWGRVLVTVIGEPGVYDRFSWLGYGIGVGSNLANFVRTGENQVFTLAESESGRILLEGGLIGYLFILLKFALIFWATLKAIRLSFITHSPFPLLIWIATAIALISWSAIGQLTSNGLLGVMLGFGLLTLRFSRIELFPSRVAHT